MTSSKMDRLLEGQAVTETKIDVLNNKVDRCLVGLYGSTEHPENGLTVKVDRLEQIERTRSKVIWVVVVAMLGMVSKQIWAVIRW